MIWFLLLDGHPADDHHLSLCILDAEPLDEQNLEIVSSILSEAHLAEFLCCLLKWLISLVDLYYITINMETALVK